MVSKKFLKSIATSSIFAGLLISANAESPLYSFGDDANLYGLLSASATYNDNLYLRSSDKKGDMSLKLTPGLQFIKGEKALSRISLLASYDLIAYMDETDNNAQLEHIDAVYSYGDTNTAFRFTVAGGFHHLMSMTNRDSRNIINNGQQVKSYNYFANLIAEADLGEKALVRSGFKWNGITYDNYRSTYRDRQTYAIPVSLFYVYSDKLNIGINYEYRQTDLKKSYKQDVHFIGAEAEGEIAEKLTVKGRVGYTMSDYDNNIDSSSTLGANLRFDYIATESGKLNLYSEINRDFEISGDAQSITSTGIRVGGLYSINESWSANASIAYSLDDYTQSNREDDVYSASVGAGYIYNKYLSFAANYTIQLNDSNIDTVDYSNNIFSVSAKVRY